MSQKTGWSATGGGEARPASTVESMQLRSIEISPPSSNEVEKPDVSAAVSQHSREEKVFEMELVLYVARDDPDKRNSSHKHSCCTKLIRLMLRATLEFPPWRSLMLVIIWAAAAVGISTAAARHLLPEERYKCRYLCTPIAIQNNVVTYVGFALFFLLGFRVNEAQGRYQEGVTIWRETMTTTIASFATHAGRGFPDGMWHSGDRKRLLGWLIAFPITLKAKLRSERDISELRSVLSQEDVDMIQGASNMPACVLGVLNTYILEATVYQDKLPQVFIDRMLRYLGTLSMSMNKCARIVEYDVNLGYLVHLRLFLAIWLAILPFSLVEHAGWFTVLLVPFIAYGMLGMEKIAVLLTHPFGYDLNDIPIGLICNQMAATVQRLYVLSMRPAGSIVRPSDALLSETSQENEDYH